MIYVHIRQVIVISFLTMTEHSGSFISKDYPITVNLSKEGFMARMNYRKVTMQKRVWSHGRVRVKPKKVLNLATTKQLDLLKKLNINCDSRTITKLKAWHLISTFFKEKESKASKNISR